MRDNVINSTETLDASSPVVSHAGSDRRAAAWLHARLAKGRKERFCEIVKVTPALAEALLEHNSHNRPCSAGTVRRYADLMMRGMWRLTTEGIAVSSSGVLINGQHRLAAIVEAGHGVEMTVWFGCRPDEFEVADQGVKRSAAHVLAIKGYQNATTAAAVAALLGRFRLFEDGHDPRGLPTQDVVATAESLDHGRLMEACTNGLRLSRVAAPTGPALAYWHITQTSAFSEKLPEFWEGLSSGEGLFGVKLQLREWLDKGPYAKRNGDHITVKRAAAIVLAWNTWLRRTKRSASLEWKKANSLPAAL